MNYKIKDLVSKINEHIKKIEKQGDPNALEKLTQLQKLMIKKA
ncbi:MAG TPA: hypothetical protein PLZ08_12915 [Bacillota bacterium]|nr:hypothetical protein [Bacillota bacterium]HOL11113.1 hypothetical protein [Bacillota bacterium]HPO98840.1 hypothetical protein [Bacillota bacterium]